MVFFFAVVGFYFLTIQEKFILAIEDSILLLGALMWAFHILWVDYAIKKKSYLFQIAFFQVLLVCILSFIAFFYPEAQYCTDNGAMIAFCTYLYKKKNILEKLPLPIASSRSSF